MRSLKNEGKTIARLNPLGNPGSDRIKVLFSVNEQRFLKITVEDLLTNEILLQSACFLAFKRTIFDVSIGRAEGGL